MPTKKTGFFDVVNCVETTWYTKLLEKGIFDFSTKYKFVDSNVAVSFFHVFLNSGKDTSIEST